MLRETDERFAIVVDDDGNIDGVVTSTDIFAAIAGDLAEDESVEEITHIDENRVEADASTSLGELAEAFGRAPLASAGRYTSLGGFLLFEFGRMPNVGETIERDGLAFTIRSVGTSRIERVEVRQLAG